MHFILLCFGKMLQLFADILLQELERQICAKFLQVELNRTRLNTICFGNGHELQQTEYDPDSHLVKVSGISNNNRSSPAAASRHRRRMSGSSFSDSESGKPIYAGYPPQSPLSQSGYTSSDIGSEVGLNDNRLRSTDRYGVQRSLRH